ncbi:MFS general substrate transporter [Wilcoxina mikolae CBS 423.85]|nr:MFS general substrate transporter [Wilcoxina mikolae CBS 423.85]
MDELKKTPAPTAIELKARTDSGSLTTKDASELSPEAIAFERRLVWKLDLTILPFLVIIFFLAQMGCSDIANAKIAGLDRDLEITPGPYANIITAFIAGYILFQPAGTMLVRYFTPPLQLGGVMVAWGTVTVCHIVVKNWVSLLVLRLFVGISEAFVQGAALYLSFWYTYKELALRGAIFQSVSSLADAFNGLLSYGIAKDLGGVNG